MKRVNYNYFDAFPRPPRVVEGVYSLPILFALPKIKGDIETGIIRAWANHGLQYPRNVRVAMFVAAVSIMKTAHETN
jgi:hypothetical protein